MPQRLQLCKDESPAGRSQLFINPSLIVQLFYECPSIGHSAHKLGEMAKLLPFYLHRHFIPFNFLPLIRFLFNFPSFRNILSILLSHLFYSNKSSLGENVGKATMFPFGICLPFSLLPPPSSLFLPHNLFSPLLSMRGHVRNCRIELGPTNGPRTSRGRGAVEEAIGRKEEEEEESPPPQLSYSSMFNAIHYIYLRCPLFIPLKRNADLILLKVKTQIGRR